MVAGGQWYLSGDRRESVTANTGGVTETSMRIKPAQKLADSYHEANLPVVRRRLYHGDVRLAMVLNEAFPEK
jgi:hypothetical protein